MSDRESVRECDHEDEDLPFEASDVRFDEYLKTLALLHAEETEYFEPRMLPDTVDDAYYRNMYTISWFYDGHYPFDTWEDNYDQWLYC
jgi:hypothetical protein